MNFQNMTKKIVLLLLLISLFYVSIQADVLSFKSGQKATYTITQNLDAEIAVFNETMHCRSEAAIDVDIEILSSNLQTSSYPIDVKITLKRVLFSEVQQEGQITKQIIYDSNSKDLMTVENHLLAEYYENVINHPLYYSVDKDFKIVETVGYITQIHESFDSPDYMGLFGATPWSYELFLTQLFHLAGENLQVRKSYPTSCYQFLNWEQASLDEEQIGLYQVSDYTVDSMDSKSISASWLGNAKVIDYQLFKEGGGDVCVAGHVIWDTTNPLIQTRTLKVDWESTTNGFIKTTKKMSMEQTWQPFSRI
ncbi:MAG TPA: hypothetical protein VGP47_04550 [Parachlamydiaceae bacterium]|nr:hypothetical protein [Parachlamydiaceae bacterium]